MIFSVNSDQVLSNDTFHPKFDILFFDYFSLRNFQFLLELLNFGDQFHYYP